MKENLRAGNFIVRTLACTVAALILASVTYSPVHARSLASSQSIHDTILVRKQVKSKKYRVKLYPNANQQVLFFTVSGDEGKIFQLFLFDVEGHLVKQVNIRNKQTTVLNKIEKGNYLFEVFSDDERIENGQLIVR